MSLLSSPFSTGYGECLLDEPTARMYEMPTLLPGQLYNANRQCELMFGPGSQVCPYMVSGSKREKKRQNPMMMSHHDCGTRDIFPIVLFTIADAFLINGVINGAGCNISVN